MHKEDRNHAWHGGSIRAAASTFNPLYPMSIRIMSQVWSDQSIQSQTELLILLAISDFASDDGHAWPSVDRLSLKSRCSESTVHRIIKKLINTGYLTLIQEGGGNHRNTNHYIIQIPENKGCHGDTGVIRDGCQAVTPQGCQAVTPNPSVSVRDTHTGQLPLGNTKSRVKFQVPTMAELELYAAKIGLAHAEIEKFNNFYESKGWKVGRDPMISWQGSMRNWKLDKDQRGYQSRINGKPSPVEPEHWSVKEAKSILRSLERTE